MNKMKKIILALLPLLAFAMTSCDPSYENTDMPNSITAEELTNGLTITAKSEGNNNLTVSTNPARYIKVYNADTNGLLAQGAGDLSVQVVPPARDFSVYVTTINYDGTVVTSGSKSITVSEFTDLPEIFDNVFGKVGDGWGTTTWTWDDSKDNYWGNNSWGATDGSVWWGAPGSTDIDEQATGKGLTAEGDGKAAWFSLSLDGVKTSRGETGAVVVSGDAYNGAGIGTMTFSGTTPPMGILPNDNNIKCYTYAIVVADGDHLVLSAPSGNGWEGWFLFYKKIDNKE